jgi:hypothetical protein
VHIAHKRSEVGELVIDFLAVAVRELKDAGADADAIAAVVGILGLFPRVTHIGRVDWVI